MIVRAPGKLVLCGEYAVLEGTAACVTAVGREAVLDLTPGPREVVALGATVAYDLDAGGVHWAARPATHALVRAMFDTARDRGIAVPGVRWAIDSDALNLGVGGQDKLGLGSSAAVAAAVARALLGDEVPAEDVFDLALAGHLRFSAGRGSGIDVAAASFGGTLRYQGRVAQPMQAHWHGLDVVCVYVGHSQSTRAFLAQTERLKVDDRPAYDDAMARIDAATDRFAAGLEAGDAAAVIAAVDAAGRGMAGLGERAGADIVSAPHRAVRRIAASRGGAAKPSGAGGGDIALAFVPAGQAARVSSALAEAGMVVLDLPLAAPGARSA